jgi:hypothetical protein
MVLFPGCACCATCFCGTTINYIDIEVEIDSARDDYRLEFTYTNVNKASPTSNPVTTITKSQEYKVDVGKISKTKFRLLPAGVFYLAARPWGSLFSYESNGRYINVGFRGIYPTQNQCVGNEVYVQLQWVKQTYGGDGYVPFDFAVRCQNAYSQYGNTYEKDRYQTWFRPLSSNTTKPSTWPYVGDDVFGFGSIDFLRELSDGIVVTDSRLTESVGTVFPTTLKSKFGIAEVDSFSCLREPPNHPTYFNRQYTLTTDTNLPLSKTFSIPNPDPECILTQSPVKQFGCEVSATIHSITLGTPSGEQNLIIDGDYGSLATGTWIPSSPTVRAEVFSSA